MKNFENYFVKKINEYFVKNNIKAIAYRSKQSKYNKQNFDILVDSVHRKYYLAVECKSIKYGFYFSAYFHKTQIVNLTQYADITGRAPYLAVHVNKQTVLYPWLRLLQYIDQGNKRITDTELSNYAIDFAVDNWLDERINLLS